MRNPYERLVSFYTGKFLRHYKNEIEDQSKSSAPAVIQYFLSNLSTRIQRDAIVLSNISFMTMIEKMYAQFSTHAKVWDIHIAL